GAESRADRSEAGGARCRARCHGALRGRSDARRAPSGARGRCRAPTHPRQRGLERRGGARREAGNRDDRRRIRGRGRRTARALHRRGHRAWDGPRRAEARLRGLPHHEGGWDGTRTLGGAPAPHRRGRLGAGGVRAGAGDDLHHRDPELDSSPMSRILVVDDVAALAGQYAYDLKRIGAHEVETATDGARALTLLEAGGFECVILDLEMPEMDGFAVLRALRHRGDETPVIVYTGTGDFDRCIAAVKLGAAGFIDKAEPMERVAQEVEHAIERARLRREVFALQAELGTSALIGR